MANPAGLPEALYPNTTFKSLKVATEAYNRVVPVVNGLVHAVEDLRAQLAALTPAPEVTPPVVTPPVVVTPAPTLDGPAALPRSVPVATIAPPTRRVPVASGADLQAALDAAQDGDELRLQSGAVWLGNFRLPNRGTAGWVTITTEAPDAALPAPGARISPTTHGPALARILTPNSAPALRLAPGAAGWRLGLLDVSVAPGVPLVFDLLALGDGATAGPQTTLASVPRRLLVDRCWVHGLPGLKLRRGIALHSADTAIVGCDVDECHDDADAQAIWGWNGPGGYLIENCRLQAATEVIGCGGPTPAIAGLIPSDITIRRNLLTRPLAWRGVWRVKNLFEMKSGQRVLFEDNDCANNWVSGQNGFAVVLQTLSDDNTAPWVQVADVTMRRNAFSNTPGGINLAARVAYDTTTTPARLPDAPTSRLSIHDNALALVSDGSLGNDDGIAFQLLNDLRDATIARNTIRNAHTGVLFDGTSPTQRLRLINNDFGVTRYPIIGNGTGPGLPTLATFAPDAVATGNVFAGADLSAYPAGNRAA